MAEDSPNGPHVADLLGLYYLDSLDDAQGTEIERHLAGCASCREQAQEAAETVAALELLTPEERAALAAAPSRDVVADPPARPAPVRGRPGGPARPPGSSAGRRPPRDRRRRAVTLARLGALLGLVLVVGGLAIGALVRGTGHGSAPPPMTAAAAAEDGTSGASLSVVATEQDPGVYVRASVEGLRPGTGYRLYAVTTAGAVHPVVEWIGDAALQEVTGTVPVPLPDLAFLTVSLSGDDAPVVSVYLSRSGAPAPPR